MKGRADDPPKQTILFLTPLQLNKQADDPPPSLKKTDISFLLSYFEKTFKNTFNIICKR